MFISSSIVVDSSYNKARLSPETKSMSPQNNSHNVIAKGLDISTNTRKKSTLNVVSKNARMKPKDDIGKNNGVVNDVVIEISDVPNDPFEISDREKDLIVMKRCCGCN